MILDYCMEQGLTAVDPRKFYDYYAANGWRLGRGYMADWKAALRSWNREDAAKAAEQKKEENPYAFMDDM